MKSRCLVKCADLNSSPGGDCSTCCLGNPNAIPVPQSSPDSEVEDIGEDGHADSGAGARDDLDEFAAPLEVLRQHHGRRLPDHRVAHAEEEAVAEMRMRCSRWMAALTALGIGGGEAAARDLSAC